MGMSFLALFFGNLLEIDGCPELLRIAPAELLRIAGPELLTELVLLFAVVHSQSCPMAEPLAGNHLRSGIVKET